MGFDLYPVRHAPTSSDDPMGDQGTSPVLDSYERWPYFRASETEWPVLAKWIKDAELIEDRALWTNDWLFVSAHMAWQIANMLERTLHLIRDDAETVSVDVPMHPQSQCIVTASIHVSHVQKFVRFCRYVAWEWNGFVIG